MLSHKEKPATLGVRVKPSIINQMEKFHRKFYIDRSKQVRCLLSYFFSLPESAQKEIIDYGMQGEFESGYTEELPHKLQADEVSEE